MCSLGKRIAYLAIPDPDALSFREDNRQRMVTKSSRDNQCM